jgi:hypothetical protein
LINAPKVQPHQILKAAQMFEKGGMVQRAIECYERIEAWDKLLQSLYKAKDFFKANEREVLANKYIPIALNKLYMIMMGEA